MASSSPPHIVLFPLMAKGHTIPLLHFARLLVHRHAARVTIFTTKANHPFISDSLSDVIHLINVLDLPFPENVPGVPSGIESIDKLPDTSMWFTLARATKLMQPDFEQALQELIPSSSVTFMVTDQFLWWTLDSATKLGIPMLVFHGMGIFAPTIVRIGYEHVIFKDVENDDELVAVPNFPSIKVSRNEVGPGFSKGIDPLLMQLFVDSVDSASKSYGILINSFYEFEQPFIDFARSNHKSKLFCVGPLCLAEPDPAAERSHDKKPFWIQWLDQKLDQGKPVLYVAFGSQAEISSEQFEEIKNGLEESRVNFLWVVRKKGGSSDDDGFEGRVKDSGLVVKEWVNQREILGHQSVQGFLSHCGWGSILESLCAKVPILAWPLVVEQPLNAKFVVEQVKIGIRVETSDGFVKSEVLQKSVKQLMEGETGRTVRKNVREYGEAAMRAMEEGGSSWNELNEMLIELRGL